MIGSERIFDDLAIILTWPDATMRGDEQWMMLFKKIGLVKNLNFKVGHTGIVIIKRSTGLMLFYDFGRYITPRGYGRARSMESDPKLEIGIKALFDGSDLSNLESIVQHFELLKPAMYGEGPLYFSIATDIDFDMAKAYGDACVIEGTYPYGAVAKNNNNCSRFITRMLMRASEKYSWLHSINFPESIKASPISNVVNAVKDRIIYRYSNNSGMKRFKMNRWQSFWFLIQKLGDNVYSHKASLLPNDQIIGSMEYSHRPLNIPEGAQYLGGVGDGAWYHAETLNAEELMIRRFSSRGDIEYSVLANAPSEVDLAKPFQFTYDSHLLFTHVIQDGRKVKITHVGILPTDAVTQNNASERYA